MGSAIPLRDDFDGPRLRRLARQTEDAAQARRLLALGEIYDGALRTDAARFGGVTLQIIRDWVLRFNQRGRAGRPHQRQGAGQSPQAERQSPPGTGRSKRPGARLRFLPPYSPDFNAIELAFGRQE